MLNYHLSDETIQSAYLIICYNLMLSSIMHFKNKSAWKYFAEITVSHS